MVINNSEDTIVWSSKTEIDARSIILRIAFRRHL